MQPVYYGYLLSVHGKINFKTFKELVIGFAFCLSVHFNLDFLCASKSLKVIRYSRTFRSICTSTPKREALPSMKLLLEVIFNLDCSFYLKGIVTAKYEG